MVLYFDLLDLENFRFEGQKWQQTPLPLLLTLSATKQTTNNKDDNHVDSVAVVVFTMQVTSSNTQHRHPQGIFPHANDGKGITQHPSEYVMIKTADFFKTESGLNGHKTAVKL